MAEISRFAAFHEEHAPRACRYLWDLGKNDERQLHSNPDHGIRILQELCAVEPRKPSGYVETIVEFAISLTATPDAWSHVHNPFEILVGAIKPDGHVTTSDGISITWHNYVVNPELAGVRMTRDRIVRLAIDLLRSSDVKIGVRAARFLGEALRFPRTSGVSLPLKHLKAWENEFVQTIRKIEEAIQAHPVDVLVHFELLKSVGQLAARKTFKRCGPWARKIIRLYPKTLQARTCRALIDGWGHTLEEGDWREWQKIWNEKLELLAAELLRSFKQAKALVDFIEGILAHIAQYYPGEQISPNNLLGRLCRKSVRFSEFLIDEAIKEPKGKINESIIEALQVAMRGDNRAYIASKMLRTKAPILCRSVALAYLRVGPENLNSNDIKIFKRLIAHNDEAVVCNTLWSIQHYAKCDPRGCLRTLVRCNAIGKSAIVADRFAELFVVKDAFPFERLDKSSLCLFLKKMVSLRELDGHSLESFLALCSERHSNETISFFLARLNRARRTRDWRYTPCGFGKGSTVRLRFRQSGNFKAVFDRILALYVKEVARGDGKSSFNIEYHYLNFLAAAIFPIDEEIAVLLEERLRWSSAVEFQFISDVLGEAEPSFVFENYNFVCWLLAAAKEHGNDTLRHVQAVLRRPSVEMERSGDAGALFPQDLELKARAEEMLAKVDAHSVAADFYKNLLGLANDSMKRSRERTEELFED